MNIRLADYRLGNYCLTSRELAKHGDKVCSSNGCKSVGTIIDIKRANDSWDGKMYTVLWGTGSKRGKTTVQAGRTLVHLKLYLQDIQEEVAKVTALMEEASTLGM
jgi:hypothetical protein